MEALLTFVFVLGLPLGLVVEELVTRFHRTHPRPAQQRVTYKHAPQHSRA